MDPIGVASSKFYKISNPPSTKHKDHCLNVAIQARLSQGVG